MTLFRASPEAQQAVAYQIKVAEVSPRFLRVVGPNCSVEVRRGAGDSKLRLFTGQGYAHQSHGVVSETYAFEEAFKLASHQFSQASFKNQMESAQEGEQSE